MNERILEVWWSAVLISIGFCIPDLFGVTSKLGANAAFMLGAAALALCVTLDEWKRK